MPWNSSPPSRSDLPEEWGAISASAATAQAARRGRARASQMRALCGGLPRARMHLDGHVRERMERGQPLAIERRRTRHCGCDRNDGADVARPEPPQMQVAQPVAVALDRHADVLRHEIG